jgi:hypothetical protein
MGQSTKMRFGRMRYDTGVSKVEIQVYRKFMTLYDVRLFDDLLIAHSLPGTLDSQVRGLRCWHQPSMQRTGATEHLQNLSSFVS